MAALHSAGFLHPVELRPAGFEPAACGLGNRRSIHLSYEREVLIEILSHGTVCCQCVCDAFREERARDKVIIQTRKVISVLPSTGRTLRVAH
jgi:hypothetical protein